MKNNRKEEPSVRLLLIDLLCMEICLLMAAFIRFGEVTSEWFLDTYSIYFVILLLVDIGIFFIQDTYTGFFQRGFLSEAKVVLKHNILIAVTVATLMYLTNKGANYAGLFYVEYMIIKTLLTYLARQYYKVIMLGYYKKSALSNKMVVITTYAKAPQIIDSLKRSNLSEHFITSIAIIDKDVIGEKIHGIPISSNRNNLMDTIKYEVIDEVFICIPPETIYPLKLLIEELETMGIKVLINIDGLGLDWDWKIQHLSKYRVLTITKKEFKISQLFLKRVIDIIGALVGLLCTTIITICVAPIIYIESPGPILFSHIRIGKNGRRFHIYKFRSMYQDAEERKAELLTQNEMQGCMFKMKEDPRITKIGKFLRETSLDELPQFFNVLKGDMSLVGTRPPTEDEFLNYESRHKRRLTLKPGITGLWQVSGRSDITDFEDVVRMDLEYIDNWSIALDVKLLIKTVWVLFNRRGAR